MSKLSQKDYLKKYLSSDDKLRKKKKKADKEKKVKVSTVKIIDDDEYQHGHLEIDESELFTMNEEAPQIVGIIDERAPEVLMKQEYIDSGKWKKIGETSKKNKQKKNKRRSLSREVSDASPPRIQSSKLGAKARRDSDESPPRRGRLDLPDASPPRRNRRNSDESPPRSRKRKESSDVSPPRRKRKDSDASPPRRKRQDSDNSPPRARKRQDSDASPPRARRRQDSDASPPRRHRESPSKSRKRDSPSSSRRRSKSPSRRKRSRWSPEIKQEPQSPRGQDLSPPRSSRMTKTLDGKASGLQDAKTLKKENDEFKKRQDKMFREMRPEMLGRDAEVVIRDRRGRNKDFEREVEEERKKTAFEEARKKDYDRWGKGLKQIEDLEKRFQEHMHEANKPLARGADDEDLQEHLKQQERLDDPMLAYMRKKKQEENKKKGVKEKPKYLGQFPDNRYGIPPGYRWDGVDRSNGYEKKYFSMIASKKSVEEEAYRYSTEDM